MAASPVLGTGYLLGAAVVQPFDKHPADPAALRQTAAELRELADEALELAAATRAAYQSAVDNWHGMGATEMAAAGEPVQRDAKTESGALRWSADVTDYWAIQVEGFNREVDAITAGLAARAADDYGATGTGGAPPTAAQVADARGAATAAARQQWMQAYDTYIDTGRHRAAAMLARGPTEGNLAELREAGVLPDRQATGASQGDDDSGFWSSLGHGVLDVAGLVPVIGEPADAANAAWYAAEGDYTNAALSAAAMVPIAGWAATDNAGQGSIYRLRYGNNHYLDAQGNLHTKNSLSTNPQAANDTHIPYPKDQPRPDQPRVRVAAPNPAGLAGPDGDQQ